MDYFVQIENMIEEHNGFLVTDFVTKANIPRVYIRMMLDRGDIVKAERGIYIKKGVSDDRLYRVHLKYKGLVYSHETALMLNGLLKQPKNVPLMVTIKTGLNPTALKEKGMKVFTMKKELMDVGLITVETKNGNPVKCYNIERSVCDIVRSRNQLDNALLAKTLNTYFKSDLYDKDKLFEMADILHVSKVIENYQKVLIV